MSVLSENKAVFYRWFGEVWNQGHFDVAYEVIAPEMNVHGAGGQPVKQGPDGLIALIQTWRSAFPDGSMSIDGLAAKGDLVAALLTWRGTHQGEFYGVAPTGRQVACTSIGIDRMQDGKVVDGWGELDMVGMMQQMGALPLIGPGAVSQGRSPEWGPPGGAVDAGASSPEDNEALALRFANRVNQGDGDVEAMVDVSSYAEHNPVWGATDLASSTEVDKMLRDALPDLVFTIDPELVIGEDDKVAVHGVMSGTHTGGELFGIAASGKQVTWTHSEMVRVAGGRVTERWVCADTLSLMQQVGALPAGG